MTSPVVPAAVDAISPPFLSLGSRSAARFEPDPCVSRETVSAPGQPSGLVGRPVSAGKPRPAATVRVSFATTEVITRLLSPLQAGRCQSNPTTRRHAKEDRAPGSAGSFGTPDSSVVPRAPKPPSRRPNSAKPAPGAAHPDHRHDARLPPGLRFVGTEREAFHVKRRPALRPRFAVRATQRVARGCQDEWAAAHRTLGVLPWTSLRHAALSELGRLRWRPQWLGGGPWRGAVSAPRPGHVPPSLKRRAAGVAVPPAGGGRIGASSPWRPSGAGTGALL